MVNTDRESLASTSARTLPRCAAQDHEIVVGGVSDDEWQRMIDAEPQVPRNVDELRGLIAYLFDDVDQIAQPITLPAGFTLEEKPDSLSHALQMLELGFENPSLSNAELDDLDALLASKKPKLPLRFETAHFLCKYTTTGEDDRFEPHLVKAIGKLLEEAFIRYTQAFGREPYIAPNREKIIVEFYSLPAGKKGTVPKGKTAPRAPISLNSKLLRGNTALAWTTAVHELFHRLQFSFGFRVVDKTPSTLYHWFTEGSAAWSSLWVTGKFVKRPDNVAWLFEKSNERSLFAADYYALPAWLFMELSQREQSAAPIRQFLESYSAHHDLNRCFQDFWHPNNRLMFGVSMAMGWWRSLGLSYHDREQPQNVRYSPMYAVEPPDKPVVEPVVQYFVSGDLYPDGPEFSGTASLVEGGFLMYRFTFDQLAGRKVNFKFTPIGADSKISVGVVYTMSDNSHDYWTMKDYAKLDWSDPIEGNFRHVTVVLMTPSTGIPASKQGLRDTRITWSVAPS